MHCGADCTSVHPARAHVWGGVSGVVRKRGGEQGRAGGGVTVPLLNLRGLISGVGSDELYEYRNMGGCLSWSEERNLLFALVPQKCACHF